MLLQLNIHPSRQAELRSTDVITSDPPLASTSYLDRFSNRVTRFDVPPGLITFSNRLTIHDSGDLDETPPGTVLAPVPKLPDDVMAFLVSSRYCDSDKLADFVVHVRRHFGSPAMKREPAVWTR